jgi:Arylsulfotransferase (ASST)
VPTSQLAANLSVQTYNGQPALSWWQGVVTSSGQTTSGEDVVVDQHYHKIATLKGRDGWVVSQHEMVIQGTDAWVTAYKNVKLNLTHYHGRSNGVVSDAAVQEYDLKTGKLLFTWDALNPGGAANIPLSKSEQPAPKTTQPWDAYHVNSIQLVGENELLVSMRNTFAVYLVNIATGKIIWTLGGKHSNFKLGPGANFQWQHDVSLEPNSTVTLFDDHCCQISGAGTFLSATAPSRGLVLRLDQATHAATLVAQYGHGRNFDADYMGDTQPLSNGNVFIGWGSQPYFSEYSASGKLLLDASFPTPDLTYRSTLESWAGMPLYPPAGAARAKDGKTLVYASWNGATQVASWKVWAQTSTGKMALVAWYDRSGFETAMPVPRGFTTFEVQALNSREKVIGASKVFRLARS